MRVAAVFAALGLLAGCVEAPAPLAAPLARPERIDLLANRLTVHFSDGTACRADIAAAPTGHLAGCATAMDYAVTVQHRVWVQGAEPFMEPYASVRLTRLADGRRFDWQTPEGDSDHTAPNTGSLGN